MKDVHSTSNLVTFSVYSSFPLLEWKIQNERSCIIIKHNHNGRFSRDNTWEWFDDGVTRFNFWRLSPLFLSIASWSVHLLSVSKCEIHILHKHARFQLLLAYLRPIFYFLFSNVLDEQHIVDESWIFINETVPMHMIAMQTSWQCGIILIVTIRHTTWQSCSNQSISTSNDTLVIFVLPYGE